MTERDRYENAERSRQVYASLGFAFVCIVIGVPLWWKTTEVYRVPLPYEDIADIYNDKIYCRVDFSIVVFDRSIDKMALAAFSETLKSSMQEPQDAGKLSLKYYGNIRHAYDIELEALELAESLEDLDSYIYEQQSRRNHGHFSLAILPSQSQLTIPDINMWVGTRQVAYLTLLTDLEDLTPQIVSTVKDVFVNEYSLSSVVNKTVNTKPTQHHTRQSLRSFGGISTGYDITFTLYNPQPDMVDVRWDIAMATHLYLSPLLASFEEFASISVKSQSLFYTDLYIKSAASEDGSYHYIKPEYLPRIVTPLESYLGSHVSNNAQMNFVLYVPPRDQSPLFIQSDQGELHDPNGFFSPRWGGVVIYNVPSPQVNESLPVERHVVMSDVFATFMSQIRLLLGIETHFDAGADVHIKQAGVQGVTDWELDQWLRYRTLENTVISSSTLRSLVQLLDEVGNIVINDQIGTEVEIAVSSIQRSNLLLRQGRLREAFLYSKQALHASETAFFDPSLLELLYFPEDQKFAIYIPLFLPVSIPVLLSIMKAVKYFKPAPKPATANKKKDQ